MAATPDLGLPAVFRGTITYLQHLSDDGFASLVEWLNDTSPATATDVAIDSLADLLPRETDSSATRLLEFAMSTRRLVSTLDVDSETIAQALSRALAGPEEAVDEKLAIRLRQLLDTDFVNIRSKVLGLMHESERRLADSRCMTDLRPVLAKARTVDEVIGFVVLHTLRLDVRGSRDDPVFVTVGNADLRKLRATIERAIQKEDMLTRLLDNWKLEDLTVREVYDDADQ